MIYKDYDQRDIQSFEYEKTTYSDGKVIGRCELGKATIQLINKSNNYSIFKDSWIKTPQGSFYIYSVEPVQEKVNIKLDCYDIKYALDKKYNYDLYTFPCTLKEWRNAIFENNSLSYDNGDFPNSELILNEQPYVGENPTDRQVIAQIAEAGASIIETVNDVFYFTWFNETTHEVIDWLELTTEKQYSNEVNCVILGRGDTEDNVSWPETKPDNPIEFRIDNNYILDPQDTDSISDQRYNVIEPIYERVNGFSYLIFNMRSQKVNNKLSVKLGERIKYSDIWGNELYAYIMTKKIKWLGGDLTVDDNYEITISASEIKETSTKISYSNSIQNDILRVERKADKNSGEIQDVVEKTSETSEQVNKVTQTANDLDISIKDVQKSLETTNGNIQTMQGTIKDMSFNFSTKGLNIGTSTDPNNSLLNNRGIKVYNYEKLNAIFNNKGSGIDKLIVTGTAQIGYLKFVKSIKNNKKVTKIFHLKNLIEDLEDLEVE